MKLRIPSQFYVFLTGVIFCLLLFGLGEKFSFITNQFGRLFAWTPGDIFDASLNNWFLENNLQYLLKGGNIFDMSAIFNTSIYWPEKNSMAMSDNWILITPIYGFFRIFLSPNFAFTAIMVLSLTTNMMACYQLCRHATDQKLYRLIASFISAFSLTVLARLGHAQLMPAFAGILAVDYFISALSINRVEKNSIKNSENKISFNQINISLSSVLTSIIFLLLQIGIGFYQGAFFTIAIFCIVLIVSFNRILQKNTKFRFHNLISFTKFRKNLFLFKLVSLISLLIFNSQLYWQYYLYSNNQGSRPWGEVSSMIPKFWSLWFSTLSNPKSVSFPAPVQNIDFNTYTGPFWEHSMFPGYTFMIILFFGIWFSLRGSLKNKKDDNVNWKIFTLGKACLLMLIISFGIGGANPVLTIWLFLWKLVPGISAIRGVSRIGIPIVLILSPFLAWTLSELHYRLDRNSMKVTLSLFLVFYLLGNVPKGIPRFDSTEYAANKNNSINKIEKIVKGQNCSAFYVSSPDTNNWMFDRVHPQMMAMWASTKIGIPTISGYSGNHPKDGWNHMLSEEQLENWLRIKGVSDEAIKDVCWINGSEIVN